MLQLKEAGKNENSCFIHELGGYHIKSAGGVRPLKAVLVHSYRHVLMVAGRVLVSAYGGREIGIVWVRLMSRQLAVGPERSPEVTENGCMNSVT